MANNLKISFEGELLRRWKEKTSSGKELIYIAVKVPRGEWSDTFRIKAKDAETVKAYAIGKKVCVSAFVGGREWKNPTTGKVGYFADLNLAQIASGEANQPEEVAATASSEGETEELPF